MKNILTIMGDSNLLDEFANAVKDERCPIILSKILPLPKDLELAENYYYDFINQMKDLSSDELRFIGRIPTHPANLGIYSWKLAYWGRMRDIEDATIMRKHNVLSYTFYTIAASTKIVRRIHDICPALTCKLKIYLSSVKTKTYIFHPKKCIQ